MPQRGLGLFAFRDRSDDHVDVMDPMFSLLKSIGGALLALVVIVLVGWIAITMIRKWSGGNDQAVPDGFTLDDLRRMKRDGELSDEEYDRAAERIIVAAKAMRVKAADAKSKPTSLRPIKLEPKAESPTDEPPVPLARAAPAKAPPTDAQPPQSAPSGQHAPEPSARAAESSVRVKGIRIADSQPSAPGAAPQPVRSPIKPSVNSPSAPARPTPPSGSEN
jgi:hypothetical protein